MNGLRMGRVLTAVGVGFLLVPGARVLLGEWAGLAGAILFLCASVVIGRTGFFRSPGTEPGSWKRTALAIAVTLLVTRIALQVNVWTAICVLLAILIVERLVELERRDTPKPSH